MKTRYVALAVAAAMGLGSVSAFAQGTRHDRSQTQWQHQTRGDWGNRGHRYYRPSHEYRRDNGNLFGALALGAITGALVGQAANAYSYAPPTYYTPPTTYYTPPTTYYSAPPAVYYNPPPAVYYTPSYGYGYYGN